MTRLNGINLSQLKEVDVNGEVLRANNVIGFNSGDKRSRSVNLLRTQLMKRVEESSVKLVGVTSPTPGAGKSFLSVNLAASVSRVIRGETALVDLDLRRGCVAEELGLKFDLGVSDFLLGSTESLQEAGVRIAGSNLSVFPTRTVASDSAQAITTPRFEDLVKQLRSNSAAGLVIFDLPPVFANDDAVLTTRMLDAFVMVVESGKTSKRQLKDAMEMLKPVPCLGVVLNRYSGGLLDSYGYGSDDYDDYYT